MYPVEENKERSSSYPDYRTYLKFDGIEFPVTLRDITKFERLNNISVNVFMFKERDKKKIVPLRLTANKRNVHISALFLFDREIIRAYRLRKDERAIVLPEEEDKSLSFRNYDRKERLPYVVYADLEYLLEKKDEGESFMTTENGFGYQHHRAAFSVGYYVKSTLNDESSSSMYMSHRGQDCVSWFAKELNSLAHRAKDILGTVASMTDLTREEMRSFSDAKFCHICGKIFLATDLRVRDHCHITGRYRGAAHSYCNLNYHNSFMIPVFLHNLSGYDAHFIIKEIANEYEGRVELLPLNKETYISFTKNVSSTREKKWHNCVKLRFVDSYKFLNESLGKLVSYLDRGDLRITRSMFFDLSDEDFELLTRKGVFSYEYVDSVDRLHETELPSREAFYSSLTREEVSDDDHKHAVNVWQRFNIKNLGEYSDLYLKTDVLLLADVFEKFHDNSIESYGLDPAHYYTIPGYTWDAMLKYTGVRFELLIDIDMVLFVERNVRGDFSQCSNRYARANNRYLPYYDSSQPSLFLIGSTTLLILTVSADSYFGYILEVDLAYSHELHDAHADLPFYPARTTPPDKRNVKLLATFYDKSHYVIHYRNLQHCLRHGLRVTTIHRVLRFAQFPWLRGYVELNTRFKIGAKNEFERNMYKLMNNAVFEKTMENVRDRVDVRLVTSWESRHGAETLIAKPNFHSRSIFAEGLNCVA
ncbi:uncharacterized protein LOC118645605 [Monomorium pharaonis]|uniref:uncharacterized protein LOC118645605 n=1 Tax=Monomorium pharaonis TaxID=307658 RepID=UPI00174785D9|nr:uncharacterized protein LOC118645605 [Monomorium pharaonis]